MQEKLETQNERPSPIPFHRMGWLLLIVGLVSPILGSGSFRGITVSEHVPLNWDMAGHFLRASEFRDAFVNGDLSVIADLLGIWSVYPPLYHLSLGAWMALLGSSDLTMIAFMWLAPVGVAIGCYIGFGAARTPTSALAYTVAVITVGGLAQFSTLSHSFMLDAPAVALAVVALGLLSELYRTKAISVAVLACLAVTAAVLTKYNIGLPLFVSIGALSLMALNKRDWRCFRILVIVGVAALLVWMLFLTWKVQGWRSFIEFSENRSNSAELTFLDRGLEYVRLFCEENFRGGAVPFVLGLLFIAGITQCKDPFWIANMVYALATFVAIARHSYLLDRLSLSVGVVFVVLASYGVKAVANRLSRRRVSYAVAFGVVAVSAATAYVATNGPTTESQLRQLYPDRNTELAVVSDYVADVMREYGDVIVLGTFNSFSENWVELLWRWSNASEPRGKLEGEFYYPGTKERTEWDASDKGEYVVALALQLADSSTDIVVAIEPNEGSIWRDGDYVLWNAWKLNYIDALRTSGDVVLVEQRDFVDADVRVSIFRTDVKAIRYGEGWGPWENWGRWANRRKSTINIPLLGEQTKLIIRATSFGNQSEAQTIRVHMDDRLLSEVIVECEPWRWQDYEVVVPHSSEDRADIDLYFSGMWLAGDGDPRVLAMPVESIRLE